MSVSGYSHHDKKRTYEANNIHEPIPPDLHGTEVYKDRINIGISHDSMLPI